MISEIKYLQNIKKPIWVIEDGHPDQEMRVVAVPAPSIEVNYSSIRFVKCEWQDDNGQIKNETFLPEQLSFLLILDLEKYPHLILLDKIFTEAFDHGGVESISLFYHPNLKNKFLGYCNDIVNLPTKSNLNIAPQSSDYEGIGSHIHWLKMFYDQEITNFLGQRFFTEEEGIRLQKISENKYAMEYLGF